MAKRRAKILEGTTERVQTNCGGLYVTMNKSKDESLFEVRLQLGKSGNCQCVLIEQLALAFSIMLQDEVEVKEMISRMKKHFVGVSCGNSFNWDGVLYKSCIDLTAQRIVESLEGQIKEEKKDGKE